MISEPTTFVVSRVRIECVPLVPVGIPTYLSPAELKAGGYVYDAFLVQTTECYSEQFDFLWEEEVMRVRISRVVFREGDVKQEPHTAMARWGAEIRNALDPTSLDYNGVFVTDELEIEMRPCANGAHHILRQQYEVWMRTPSDGHFQPPEDFKDAVIEGITTKLTMP